MHSSSAGSEGRLVDDEACPPMWAGSVAAVCRARDTETEELGSPQGEGRG